MPDYLPNTNLASYELKQKSIVQTSSSMFSGSQQVYDLGGKYWELEVDLPALDLRNANKWRSFFTRLNGQANTFYFVPIKDRFPQDNLILSGTELINTIPTTAGSYATNYTAVTNIDFRTPNNGSALFTNDGTNSPILRWPVSLEANSVYCVSLFLKPRTGGTITPSIARWTTDTTTTAGGTTANQSNNFSLPPEGTWQTHYFRAAPAALPTAYIGLHVPNANTSTVIDVSCVSCRKVVVDTTCTYNTFLNGTAPFNFGTFSGATATGFTAAHDGTGSDNKLVYAPIPNNATASSSTTAGNATYKLTFDAVFNSGSGAWAAYLTTTTSSALSPNFSTSGSYTYFLKAPSTGTTNLSFYTAASSTSNVTFSNIKLVKLDHIYSVQSATANANSLTIASCPVSHPNIFTAGDYISISNNLYMVTQNVASSITGTATVNIFPALRSSYSANTQVMGVNPTGTFRLSQNSVSQGVTTPDSINGIGFSAREVF